MSVDPRTLRGAHRTNERAVQVTNEHADNEGDSVVEAELERQRLYETDITWLHKEYLPTCPRSQATLFLLRILFNQILTRTQEDDPVFSCTPSPIALQQVQDDFAYKGFEHAELRATQLYTALLARWCKHAEHMRQWALTNNSSNSNNNNNHRFRRRRGGGTSLTQGTLRYQTNDHDQKNQKNHLAFHDIQQLGEAHPAYLPELVAIHVRYRYIGIGHQGAARDFVAMGLKPTDAVEGFASTLNHYFDHYCSAFPDLETPFGSLGSFWSLAASPEFWKKKPLIILNPPPNSAIARLAVDHVSRVMATRMKMSLLQDAEMLSSTPTRASASAASTTLLPQPSSSSLVVQMTFPYWADFEVNETMQAHPNTSKFQVHAPGTVTFINHLRNSTTRNTNAVIEWHVQSCPAPFMI